MQTLRGRDALQHLLANQVIDRTSDDKLVGWLEAAKASPVYKMAMDWKVAFPLHPEYRTLPMVWYIPPLSPLQSAAEAGKLGIAE